MDKLTEKWDESYKRLENYLFYPKEEIVKFLNRFIRKKVGFSEFHDIYDFSKEVRGLDYGCGIGRAAILMREFGIDAYGLDISAHAIESLKKLAAQFGYQDLKEKAIVADGLKIPFADNFFDITISEGVLDSMYFSTATKVIREIDRVTKSISFISLISGDDPQHFKEYDGESIVRTSHEEGTVQNYYNWAKIQKLIEKTDFKIDWCHLITDESVISNYRSGRYYIVLRK